MPRPKGSKNKIKLNAEDSKAFLEELANPTPPNQALKDAVKRYKEVMFTETALSIIENPDKTLSVVKIPFNHVTQEYGQPEVIETNKDSGEIFYRFKILAGELFGDY